MFVSKNIQNKKSAVPQGTALFLCFSELKLK